MNLEVYPTSDGELTNVQRMDENDKLILAHPGGFMALDKILLDENTLDNVLFLLVSSTKLLVSKTFSFMLILAA